MLTIGFDAKRYFLNYTGLGNYSRDLIRILEKHYPDNNYIKYTPKLGDNLTAKQLADKRIQLPTSKISKMLPMVWRNWNIISDLKRDKVEIYHGLSGEIPIGLQKTGIKSVVTIHDLIFLRYPELYRAVDRWIYDQKAKYAVENADRIIAISEQTKQDLMSYYHVPEDKISVIYQVSHPAFKSEKTEEEKERIRLKYNLPRDFVLNVGSIEPRKNAFQIVKAIEGLEIPLVIIGKETPYTQSIKEYIASKGMENQVIFMKGLSMEELATIYAMANIFIYPSKFEGFGIPIIEALYSGTPVITTNSGVFPEAAGPFSNYIDPENVAEIRKSIQLILSDSELANKMAVKGREYAQRFNDEIIAQQIMGLYQQLV